MTNWQETLKLMGAVWLSPRRAVRRVLDAGLPWPYLLPLVLVYGISFTMDQISFRNLADFFLLRDLLLFSLLIGIGVGLVGIRRRLVGFGSGLVRVQDRTLIVPRHVSRFRCEVARGVAVLRRSGGRIIRDRHVSLSDPLREAIADYGSWSVGVPGGAPDVSGQRRHR